jgi:hypothetical protein
MIYPMFVIKLGRLESRWSTVIFWKPQSVASIESEWIIVILACPLW